MTDAEHQEHKQLTYKWNCADITPQQIKRLEQLDAMTLSPDTSKLIEELVSKYRPKTLYAQGDINQCRDDLMKLALSLTPQAGERRNLPPEKLKSLRDAAYKAREEVSNMTPEQKAELETAARAKAHPTPPQSGETGSETPRTIALAVKLSWVDVWERAAGFYQHGLILERELTALREQVERREDRIKRLQQQMEDHYTPNGIINDVVTSYQNIIADQKNQIAALTSENESLRKQVEEEKRVLQNAIKVQDQYDEECVELRELVIAKNAELASLKTRVEEARDIVAIMPDCGCQDGSFLYGCHHFARRLKATLNQTK